MIDIANENLKLTIWPGSQSETGIHLDIADELRSQVHQTLGGVSGIRETMMGVNRLQPMFRIIQARIIDQLYGQTTPPDEFYSSTTLQGENGSELRCEVFQPWEPLRVSRDVFEKRTRLKIQRTLLNLRELEKAYPDNYDLSELMDKLSNLNLDSSAGVLRQKIMAVTRTTPFHSYLSMKQQFVDDWVTESSEAHADANYSPLDEAALSATMKALQQQKPLIEKKPEVLRYKDQNFFRYFNVPTHGVMNSLSTDFWKTEDNRDCFLQFMMTIRSSFPDVTPFFVFRFENSFTYLLCGFSDESLLKALEENRDVVPVHAKIIMRQANHSYRELTSEQMMNSTLYYNCLKEAMRPFVNHLNQHLQMGLPNYFLRFFEV